MLFLSIVVGKFVLFAGDVVLGLGLLSIVTYVVVAIVFDVILVFVPCFSLFYVVVVFTVVLYSFGTSQSSCCPHHHRLYHHHIHLQSHLHQDLADQYLL